MPKLAGLTVAAATKRLRRAGCTGKLTSKRPKARKGFRLVGLKVKQTTPAAGKVIPAGSPVVLRLKARSVRR